MADQVSINIRQTEAIERITAACSKLGAAGNLGTPDFVITHRVPGIEVALRFEAIADFLEAATKLLVKQKADVATREAAHKGR
jgi:hypothetical protein